MSQSPTLCQPTVTITAADRPVMDTILLVAASGRGADMHEVRDLLVLCYGMSEDDAGAAIAETQSRGLIRFRDIPAI